MPASQPTLSVSSFSLREQLGALEFSFRDAEGEVHAFFLDHPRLFPISDYPRRAAEAFGVAAVEAVGAHFEGLADPEVDRFERGLRDSGVDLLNIALDIGDLSDSDDQRRDADVSQNQEWIARFADMGARFVRVNPCSPFTPHRDGPPQHLIDTLGSLGEFTAAQGARLLIENHVGPSSQPAWMASVLEAVGRDACGLLLDLGNFAVLTQGLQSLDLSKGVPDEQALIALGERLDLTSVYDGIAALAPAAEMVSVKEHLVLDDGSIGFIDLDRALGILVAAGFDGPYSIEYEGAGGDPWEKTGRILDVTREVVTRLQAGDR